ncbi:AI-2E family transporter [Corynebacterium sanguinis]|nr:AI-2E family transporter [Corynebacterium sanguinis]MCT1555222.1 AI-2E family transporter [Corynebacterium sanguinis]MCT1584196.1 AI-2E family transporter [Corynebacterium sanguinis]MCT1695869.1 AI-2E family transporter [Corynebacterium sanguinis]MCT1715295.1 AI-2E family transporter [Corynebacterium sanguinis]MCT2159093.1 AI-2E family transporter [Corynebacterium sanguinis]
MRDGAPEPKVDDERRDIVDRGVVLNSWLKSAAMTVLRILIICVFLFALSQLIGTFWQGILPVILAIIVCTVLAPIAGFLRRRAHFPSALAALISLLIFFGLIGTLVFLIAPDIAAHSRVLYLQAFEGIQRLQLWLQGPPINMDPDDLNEAVNTVAQWLQNQAGTIAGGVFAGIGTAAGLIITLTVVLVLTFFFLKDGPRFLPWLRATAGGRPGLHATELLTRAWNTLSGFIRAQAIVSLVDAFFIGVGIWLVGVPMAFTLSVITFIAGFIPIVGAVVAGALAVLIALVSLGFTEAIIVLLIVLAVQQLEGNVLSPVLQSKAMDLHPVIVLVSVTIGGGLFGLVGAFLAVPVAAMIAVVFRYMMDVMQIHSGEKKADQLIFSTPEGLAIAELEEQESIYERKEWRGDRDWATTPLPAKELVSPPKGSQSWKVLRSSGELLQLAKPSELRRRFAARDKGSNT